MNLKKHKAEIAQFVQKGDFVPTPEGILVHGDLMAKGRYRFRIRDEEWEEGDNLVTAEGILHTLGVTLNNASRFATWYIAPYAGAVSPASTWTAANFASTASEITSGTEGYSESVRQTAVFATPATGAIATSANATFTIACTTSINLNGVGLLSSNVKGGTTGVLMSAFRFGATRVGYNGDPFYCGYTLTLTA